jgi:endonuclease G
MRKFLILLFLLFSFFKADCQYFEQSLEPISKTNDQLINHKYYSLAYNETHKQAYWVYYRLTPDFINGNAQRKNNFKPEPLIEKNTVALEDYKESGFDRGHLCPAGSMRINQLAMDESFYLSNISPQRSGFNRGIWKILEEQVRIWVVQEDTLFVVTGPIFKDRRRSIGTHKITIPAAYYKVIYDPTADKKMAAFILPHKKSKENIFLFAVSVDEVEQQTGIDFFSGLDDELEKRLEAEIITW